MRQFNLEWFNTSYSGWFEYSVKVDAAFCLCCYLFKNEHGGHERVGDSFTKSDRDDEVKKIVLQSAPQNNIMIAPYIQKEIVNACAKEIMKAIVEDLNGDYFGILVDESKDVSHKEQMAFVLRCRIFLIRVNMITKFFKAIPTPQTSGSGSSPPTPSSSPSPTIHDHINPSARLNKEKMLNLNLEPDPAERKQISEYPPNLRDQNIVLKLMQHFDYVVTCLKMSMEDMEKLGILSQRMMRDLINQEQSILTSFDKQSKKIKSDYRVRLNASIDVTRFLLKQGIFFRGHDEGETSTKRGNFVELLQWYADRDDEVKKVVLQSSPQTNMMIPPNIQKKIVNACAKEIMKAIVEDLNGDYFGILVDESKDVFHKEQMALVLRYVNKEGKLIERFLSIVHVKKTTPSSLQKAIYDLLLEHSLSPSQIRGQGYDGASNMQGEINGLKTLILKDNPSAYCIHCFAHQLQLTLVVVAKKHCDVDQFFEIVANVLNIVGSSFKRRDMLREDQAKKLEEIQTVRNFITLFSSIINVLEFLASEGANYLERNDLNMALQRKDQDIINAMKLVGFAKRQLQGMRESKWEYLINDASSFCAKHDIVIPEMDKNYHLGKSKCRSSSVTYSHHLRIEVFNTVIDLQLSELNSRFDAVNSNLLLGMDSLGPEIVFANYDKERIMKLATLYPHKFSGSKLEDLRYELDNYILFVKEDNNFSNLKGLGDLSETLVEIDLYKTWRLVFLLVKLSLILPIATATVEKAFSSMKYIKNDLRSRIGDEFLNDCLVCYIEDEVFETIPCHTSFLPVPVEA
ncbi:uncharacterized protein [Nicotiana sylvestris]|uniref:uncharacterized protein n=1 Tax=Nicotiana sylvestris TaxID=4096 RepID=UPI00388C65ED